MATTLAPGRAFAELLHALPRLGAVLAPLDPRSPARGGGQAHGRGPLEGPEAEAELREAVDPEALHSRAAHLGHGRVAQAGASDLRQPPRERACLRRALGVARGRPLAVRCCRSTTWAGWRSSSARRSRPSRPWCTSASSAERVRAGARGRRRHPRVARAHDARPSARRRASRRAPALRALLLGGGPIPGELLEWARDAGLPVLPVYGMTETASLVVAGSPGEPVRGAELAIAADGEILVRGPMVSTRCTGRRRLDPQRRPRCSSTSAAGCG